MINILWASKTGDANSWYHIKPFQKCNLVDKLFIVRYSKTKRVIDGAEYFTFSSSNKPIEITLYILKTFKVLLTKKIDLVVAFNPYPWGLISFLLAKIFRKPILLGLIGGELEPNRTSKFKRKLLCKILKYVDIVTVTGKETKLDLVKMGIKKDKVFIFPHLVDIDYLNQVEKSLVTSNMITITSFLPVKRTEDAIKSLALLVDNGVNFNMVILGDGPGKENCIQLAKELKVEKHITFEGYVKDIRPYINNSEYYLQTSSSEGLSIALIESMAVGLIPLVTNVGDEKEVIKDKETGFFIPVGSPEMIANQIVKLETSSLKKNIKNNIEKKMHKSTIQFSNEYIGEILSSIKK